MRILFIGIEPDRMTRLQREYYSLRKNYKVKILRPILTRKLGFRIISSGLRYLIYMLQILVKKSEVYHLFNIPDILAIPLLFKRGIKVYDIRSPWAETLSRKFGKSILIKFAGLIERKITKEFDYCIAVNYVLAIRTKKWGAKSSIVIPNYPPKSFKIKIPKLEFRKQLQIPANAKIVFYSGAFSKIEGPYDFIKSHAKNLKAKIPEIHFLFVGDGVEMPRLKKYLMNNPEIREFLTLPGWISHEDIPNWINIADVCIVPRDNAPDAFFYCPESITKIGEYLALHKIVVASPPDGYKKTKMPVIAVSPENLPKKIIDIFTHPENYKLPSANFWWEEYCEGKLLKLYDEISKQLR